MSKGIKKDARYRLIVLFLFLAPLLAGTSTFVSDFLTLSSPFEQIPEQTSEQSNEADPSNIEVVAERRGSSRYRIRVGQYHWNISQLFLKTPSRESRPVLHPAYRRQAVTFISQTSLPIRC